MGNKLFFGISIAITLLLAVVLAYAVVVQGPDITLASEKSVILDANSSDSGNNYIDYFPKLTFEITRNLTQITNDRGSHAHMDMAIYRPAEIPDGWYWIGDLVVPNYDRPTHGAYLVRVLNPGYPDYRDLLAPPVDWNWVYSDQYSGAKLDTSFWEPVPPEGYVALGCIAVQGYYRPDPSKYPELSKFRCVRRDLVLPAIEKTVLWSDHGSGARYDCMLWSVTPADSNSVDLSTFWARHDYNMNPVDSVYCLDKNHLGPNLG